jgi:hypothetical protein
MAGVDIFYFLNICIVLVGCCTIYCSIRLAHVLNSKFPNIWWYICPLLVIWGVGNRLLIVIFSGTSYVEDIAALNLPWWVGITIFIRQVRIVAEGILIKHE